MGTGARPCARSPARIARVPQPSLPRHLDVHEDEVEGAALRTAAVARSPSSTTVTV